MGLLEQRKCMQPGASCPPECQTTCPDYKALQEIAARYNTSPVCKVCGGSLVYSRLYGTYCSKNRDHRGIVWHGK